MSGRKGTTLKKLLFPQAAHRSVWEKSLKNHAQRFVLSKSTQVYPQSVSKGLSSLTFSTSKATYSLKICAGVVETAGRRVHGFQVESMDRQVILSLPTMIECNVILKKLLWNPLTGSSTASCTSETRDPRARPSRSYHDPAWQRHHKDPQSMETDKLVTWHPLCSKIGLGMGNCWQCLSRKGSQVSFLYQHSGKWSLLCPWTMP